MSLSGYAATQRLLALGKPFTALSAFNDVSAIGAIRAVRQAGLRVPDDVSVVGFDDIPRAAHQTPSLTTIHQPLREMGKRAAETVLYRISKPNTKKATTIVVTPKFCVTGIDLAMPRSVAAGLNAGKGAESTDSAAVGILARV